MHRMREEARLKKEEKARTKAAAIEQQEVTGTDEGDNNG